MLSNKILESRCDFSITVLGRTLEHLGVQMYKRRDIAIAELVANAWDAGATQVYIEVPRESEYHQQRSKIVVRDNGSGMNDEQIQNEYLVIGRNRRSSGSDVAYGRPVMGRKGIGKLAGFGIASKMSIETWRDGMITKFALNVADLKTDAGKSGEVAIDGIRAPVPSDIESPHGTRVVLENLKNNTPIDIERLYEALSRRFSRRVAGAMEIYINEQLVGEPTLEIESRFPEEGYASEKLSDGNIIKYYYAFSKNVIRSPELRGFTIYVRGKTAQAPPFFFQIEGTASGQHGTRYITGAIEADFLDEGIDDESDLISTDRQEIDWDDLRVKTFKEWGQQTTRQILRQWADRKGTVLEHTLLEDVEIRARVDRLDRASRQQVSKILRDLGQAEPAPEKVKDLGSALVRAFEYQHFHDVVQQIEDVQEDPQQLYILLEHLSEWKVLESRAILEVVKGRLDIISKFHAMIVNNSPETTKTVGGDNMHDLLAGYPWLLNPEWQVLAEEKRISTQLQEWKHEDIQDDDKRMRYDFMALTDDKRLVVVEIKRSGHSVELEELQRLERYKERLSLAHMKDLYMLMICGGIVGISPSTKQAWEDRADGEIQTWSEIYEKTKTYYEHYRAILEGDVAHGDFIRKEREVAQTRSVLTTGSVYRGKDARAAGLGPQDVSIEGDVI